MDLSIIIISYNTRQMTLDCLASVYDNLGSLEVEVFVVDNASTDSSPDTIAERFPQTKLIRNTDNRGFAAANNQAIHQSIGRHILLLNSDTLVLGDVLSASVRYMDEHPEVGIMGCRVLNTDRTLQRTCAMAPSIVNQLLKMFSLHRFARPAFLGREHYVNWARDSEREVGVVTGCYLLARRAGVAQVGLLDEGYFFNYEETDWCERFRRAGWSVRLAPVGEIVHHGGASSGQHNPRRELWLIRGRMLFFKKHRHPAVGWLSSRLAHVFWWSRWLACWLGCKLGRPHMAARRDAAAEVLRQFPRPSDVQSQGDPKLSTEGETSPA